MTQKVLIDYLIPKSRRLIVINHPWVSDPDRTPIMEIYSGGRLVRTYRFFLPRFLASSRSFPAGAKPYFLFKFVDFISTLFLTLSSRESIDLYIGIESVNALPGLILRVFRRVKHIVYFNFDLIPANATYSLARTFILMLDTLCLLRADIAWNNSPFAQKTRRSLSKKASAKQIFVLGASPPPKASSFQARKQRAIAYMGSVNETLGVKTVIHAMPSVLQKVPDAHLHIIGKPSSESFMSELLNIVRNLHIERAVTFHGFLADSEIEKIFSGCRIGVAPYTEPVFDSSKIRYYVFLGLPVVFSNLSSEVTNLVERFHAGQATRSDYRSFAEAICAFLLDDHYYKSCLTGCLSLAQALDSDKEFDALFSESFAHMTGEEP